MSITVHKRLLQIAKREVIRIATKPMYLFCMVIAPIFSYIFFTTLMSSGLPTNMPAGVVDLDNTSTTRTIIRNLDAFQQTKIVAHYGSFNEARGSHPARRNLFILLHSGRDYRESNSRQTT